MKHRGCILEFTEERNTALFQAFCRLAASAKRIVMPDIFEQTVESPASRFWVSEERAAIVVARMEKGLPLHGMRDAKREMFEEIFRRYSALRLQYPDAPRVSLVREVVHQPAPKFYLSPGTARRMYFKIRKCRKQKRQRSL